MIVAQPYEDAVAAMEPDYAADMQLPAGETCGSCVHTRRCCTMFGHVPEDTSCDFWPSRFRKNQHQEADDGR